jgi:hypothetical protein
MNFIVSYFLKFIFIIYYFSVILLYFTCYILLLFIILFLLLFVISSCLHISSQLHPQIFHCFYSSIPLY